MSPELEQQLFDKYPKIFGDRTKPMTQTCMCWGLEIPDSWSFIIDALCNAIDHPYSTCVEVGGQLLHHDCPQVIADQVKSKFAGLRFYAHTEDTPQIAAIREKDNEKANQIHAEFNRYLDGAIGVAESLSMMTCEETGRPGQLVHRNGSPHGWMKTLCPEEAIKQGYAKVEWPKEEVERSVLDKADGLAANQP